MTNNELVDVYASELIDRCLRFYVHLNLVESEFYRSSLLSNGSNSERARPGLLQSFKHCILGALKVGANVASDASSGPLTDARRDILMDLIRFGFLSVNKLHEEGLSHLPRPSEPVELRRFCRIISKHVLNRPTFDLYVYIGEATVDGAFVADPISQVKQDQFKRMVDIGNVLFPDSHVDPPTLSGTEGIHVTIARIGARNPVHWPTLMHEAAHKLLTAEVIGEKNLQIKFGKWLDAKSAKVLFNTKIDLNSWLTEIWCDLFAALVIGPAFFFSQYSCFISSPNEDNKALNAKYPPHSVRLRLIALFLKHKYEFVKNEAIRSHILQCQAVIEFIDAQRGVGLDTHSFLKLLFEEMRGFFAEHFFSGSGSDSENFQSKFESMLRYVRAIDPIGLTSIEAALRGGLPAASKPIVGSKNLEEEPTSLQEVLLAACLNRLNYLRPSIKGRLIEHKGSSLESLVEDDFVVEIERTDSAILRSIQIAEWLHLLSENKTAKKALPKSRKSTTRSNSAYGAIVSDREILEYLTSGDLQVLPLVDVDQQLGSTSLDIRLGTSFEIFLPESRRSTESNARIAEDYESRRIDLDFLEHVVLLPNQFMLAHSFEYLKFPDWLAATLDGRSSYARLGLKIHMTAGMIDPGFEGVVTFELFNGGPNPIKLFPGIRIAQLRFTKVNVPWRPYSQRKSAKYSGRLQHNRSLYMNDSDFLNIADAVKSEVNKSLERKS